MTASPKPVCRINKKGKDVKATVLWFDKRDGEGMIREENGPSHFIYACNIPGAKTMFPETSCVYYTSGTEIDFDLVCGLVVSKTAGVFDEQKWNTLDQDKLAFKKDSNGNLINGLLE